jgi:hypothetical protein
MLDPGPVAVPALVPPPVLEPPATANTLLLTMKAIERTDSDSKCFFVFIRIYILFLHPERIQ